MTYPRQVNPFFQRHKESTRVPASRFAKLPRCPINASPVPRLTSLYHHAERGPYGDASYPGNCSGELIKDLLIYFAAEACFDPMTGSGTCADVCRELGVCCVSGDIRYGQDACDPRSLPDEQFPFVWLHPPYWRMKRYTQDPRDLSQAPTLDAFLSRYEQLLRNCAVALAPGGILAVLMGDYSDPQAGFMPLTYHTKRLAYPLAVADEIKHQHASGDPLLYFSAVFAKYVDNAFRWQIAKTTKVDSENLGGVISQNQELQKLVAVIVPPATLPAAALGGATPVVADAAHEVPTA